MIFLFVIFALFKINNEQPFTSQAASFSLQLEPEVAAAGLLAAWPQILTGFLLQ